MKRVLVLVLLLLVVMPAHAQFARDQAVQTDQNSGALDMSGSNPASFVISLPADSVTNLGVLVATHSRIVEIVVFGGDVIVGDDDILATGTFYVGRNIASGTVLQLNGKRPGFSYNLFAAPRGTGAATCTMSFW